MNLLQLENVAKRYSNGAFVALDDVSMSMEPGEMVTVWGERRSGRSTLLRIAAGIEAPDSGLVRFAGQDLSCMRGKVVGSEISFCRTKFRREAGSTVLAQLLASQFARRVSRTVALSQASRALERVGAERCARVSVADLKGDEVVRVAIARALTSDPRLLVIDEPTIGVGVLERDGILALLRSIADEGVAVLTSTGEGPGVMGADRVLSLDAGRLRGELTPELAPVEELARRREAHG
jgi:ABC-type sugar transport system ATPase subunit